MIFRATVAQFYFITEPMSYSFFKYDMQILSDALYNEVVLQTENTMYLQKYKQKVTDNAHLRELQSAVCRGAARPAANPHFWGK